MSKSDNQKQLLDACASGDTATMSKLISEGCDPTSTQNERGETALHIACQHGQFETVQRLVQVHDCSPLAKDHSGCVPLHEACLSGSIDIVHYLVTTCGMDQQTTDNSGNTPLHKACKGGSVVVARYLLLQEKASNLDVKLNLYHDDITAMNPFLIHNLRYETDYVTLYEAEESFMMQSSHDLARGMTTKNNLQQTAVEVACRSGHLGIIRLVVEEFGIGSYNASVVVGELTNISCQCGHHHIFKYLLHYTDISDNSHDSLYGMDAGYMHSMYTTTSHRHRFMHITRDFGPSESRITVPTHKCDSTLHAICRYGNVDTLQYFLEISTDKIEIFKAVNKIGDIPIHVACISGNIEIVQRLIQQYGCSCEVPNAMGDTPLHLSCKWGHLGLVKLLVSEFQSNQNARNKFAETPLHLACKCSHLDICKFLVTIHCDVNVQNKRKETPLHVACCRGSLDVVKCLLENGLPHQDIPDAYGDTPLFNACRSQNVGVVETLAANNYCNPLYINEETQETPLHIVSRLCKNKFLQVLLKHCTGGIDQRNLIGRTPLHIACDKNNLDIVNLLKERSDPMAQDKRGRTALHITCIRKGTHIIDSLLDNSTTNIDLKDSCGDTALHIACLHNSLDIVQLLVHHKCNIAFQNDSGDTPVLIACKHAKADIVKCLLDSHTGTFDYANGDGETPLHIACLKGSMNTVQFLVTGNYCDPVKRTNAGNTPLHCACVSGDLLTVEWLLHHTDTKQHFYNSEGNTPLHLAFQRKHLELVKLLLSKHHKTQWLIDESGTSLLHMAAVQGNMDILKFLISNTFCPPNQKNESGNTILHLEFLQPLRDMHAGDQLDRFIQRISNSMQKLESYLKCKGIDMPKPQQYYGVRGDHYYYTTGQYFLGEEQDQLRHMLELGHHPQLRYMHREEQDDDFQHGNMQDLEQHFRNRGMLSREQLNHYLQQKSIDRQELERYLRLRGVHNREELDLLFQLRHVYTGEKLNRYFECRRRFRGDDFDTYLQRHNMKNLDRYLQLKAMHAEEEFFDSQPDSHTGHYAYAYTSSWAQLGFGMQPQQRYHLVDHTALEMLLGCVKNCKVNWGDKKGNTPLHVACQLHDYFAVEKILTANIIDISCKNNEGMAPVQLARDYSIIRLLIGYGANPEDVYQHYGDILEQCKHEQPLDPFVKIFVLGNASIGKSTLVEALRMEQFNAETVVTDVEEKTAGIVEYKHCSDQFGQVLFHDFAGQHQYYSSHSAILENALTSSSSAPIFMLLSKLTDHNLKQHVHYWLKFIENHCHRALTASKPHVILIGSYLDMISQSESECMLKKALEDVNPSVFHCFGPISMDCRKPGSEEVKKLRILLESSCSSLRKSVALDCRCHVLFTFLLKQFSGTSVITMNDLQRQIRKKRDTPLPFVTDQLLNLLSVLNEGGHILLLQGHAEECWIVLDQNLLLQKVHGTLFSPDQCVVANTGVIPSSDLEGVLPEELDLQMVKEFLLHTESCQVIEDPEILSLITGQTPAAGGTSSATEMEKYYFFPALVRVEKPVDVWKNDAGASSYSCGWCLQCKPDDYLTNRFLHVLLLRLIFQYAVPTAQMSDSTRLDRQCCTWKSGVDWCSRMGVEVLVEVIEQNRVVLVLVRCIEGQEMECIKLRSAVVRKVLDAKEEFCPRVNVQESFIHPSELVNYPHLDMDEINKINIYEIAEAIKGGVPCALDQHNKMFPIERLLYFEPYAGIGKGLLSKLYLQSNHKVTRDFLHEVSERCPTKYHKFAVVLDVPPSDIRAFMDEPSCKNNPAFLLLHVFDQSWRGSRAEKGTYQELREKFDKYSIFCGRNPLVSNSKFIWAPMFCAHSLHSTLILASGCLPQFVCYMTPMFCAHFTS